jgi:hypothetical protein
LRYPQLQAALRTQPAKITRGKWFTDVICEKTHPKEADYLPLL